MKAAFFHSARPEPGPSLRRPVRRGMMAAFFRTVRLELRNLLGKKVPWLICLGYCFAVLVSGLSPWFRESYLPDTQAESLLLVALEFILPYFLVVALVAALTPVFAGEEERSVWGTAGACLLGQRGRDAAKLLAAEGYALFLCLGLSGVSLLLCGACRGLGDFGAEVFQIGDVSISPVWTIGELAVFTVLSLGEGCVLLALAVLTISARSRDAITAAGITAVLLLFEFLFHRFGFKVLLREVNIWVFFRPYYFFLLELLPFSPLGNLAALGGVLLIVVTVGGVLAKILLATGRMISIGRL